MRNEYLLRDLANGGFLPGYGFPTHVVTLNTMTMRELKYFKGKGNAREDGFGKMRGDPSRDLAVALREYAPGAEIVVKGLVYRSADITLNWHRPSNIDAAPEIQNLYHHWSCRKCGEFGNDQRILLHCPACDATQLDAKKVLEPAGFSVDLFVDPHTDVSRPTFMPFEGAKVAAINAAWRALPNRVLGEIRYSENGLVNHVSSGMHGHGYTLCLCCGRAEPQLALNKADIAMAGEHKRLRGGKNAVVGQTCDLA